MDEWNDGLVEVWINTCGWIGEWISGCMRGWVFEHGLITGRVDGLMGGWMNRCISGLVGCVDG